MIEEHEVAQTTTVREPLRGPVPVAARRDVVYGDERLPFMLSRVSWGAVFAGAAVATANQIAWAVLGMAIGFATINPAQEVNPAEGLGIGAGIWWLVTGIISLFLGGLVAGRLAGVQRRLDGMLNGITVWALTLIAGVWLASTAVGGMFGLLQSATGTVASAAAQGGASADQAARGLEQATQDALSQAGVSQAEQERLAAQARDPQAQERAAEVAASTATWVFVSLVFGVAAAAIGGWLAAPERSITASPRERHEGITDSDRHGR